MPDPVTNGCEEGTALDEATGACVPIEVPPIFGTYEEGTIPNELGECVPFVLFT
jgi:hypothetical protein